MSQWGGGGAGRALVLVWSQTVLLLVQAVCDCWAQWLL